MSVGVRHLTVLGEFKPFGLVAEALDGKPSDNVSDKYEYFLFDPEITRQRDEADGFDTSASSSDRGDHELFIRENRSGLYYSNVAQMHANSILVARTTIYDVMDAHQRIIWTTGSRVYKRFTLHSSVIMATYMEEKGRLNIMKEFGEQTIWTSHLIPLMASYDEGKMQHSVWVVEVVSSDLEVATSKLFDRVPAEVLPKQFSFRRIWQGKGAQTAASKVFMATDNDAAPIICLFIQEQKKLLSVRLQSLELNNEILFDIKPDMSWSISAIAAAPVIVTRPGVKVGLLPFGDIIALTAENTLLLYSGKQCLCRYMLPPFLKPLEIAPALQDLKIVGLADAVEGRVNVIANNGEIFRCTLRRTPSSSLANDCITAMAEGLTPSFYNHFVIRLWGDGDSAYLADADSSVDSEWESFRSVILQMCGKSRHSTDRVSDSLSRSSWEFLVNSNFHKNYSKSNFIIGISPRTPVMGSDSPKLYADGGQNTEKSFYFELLTETLDSLHAVYENLKLNILRKR
ncbi:hypothetical protein RJ640_002281 [Escallonia rubra]|uniref:Anaphase-promoting complex subunit 1 N-terminal domain-containing protein n=1 Tax=Escallonia rubra TaxID=112253 RepID=A0AA88UV14_9ASTE|nr:hypothetical protein RJ640_002281 [Escallonia rubra]